MQMSIADPFQGIWSLREEAHKSWDHIFSDEVVYFAKSGAGDNEVSHVLSEKYFNGDRWFEVHLTGIVRKDREVHFNTIIDFSSIPLPFRPREAKIHGVGIHRNSPMLVQCPEFIQLPEGIIPEGIPSYVGLKRIEDFCYCGWKQTATREICGVPTLEDREVDMPFIPLSEHSLGRKVGQFPRQVIQGGTEIMNEISYEDGDRFGRVANIHPNDVHAMIKICILADGIAFRVFEPFVEFRLKRIEMYLRPTGLHFHIYQPTEVSHVDAPMVIKENNGVSCNV